MKRLKTSDEASYICLDTLSQGWPHFLCGRQKKFPKKIWWAPKFFKESLAGKT